MSTNAAQISSLSGGRNRMPPPQYDQDAVEGYQPPPSLHSRDLSPVFDVGHFGGRWAVPRVERNRFRHRRKGVVTVSACSLAGIYSCIEFPQSHSSPPQAEVRSGLSEAW